MTTLNYCQRWFLIGCSLAALAVLLGAFGAHSLESQMADSDLSQADIEKRLGQWETAVRYHMYHALGCIVVAFSTGPTLGARSRLAGVFFLRNRALFRWAVRVCPHSNPIHGFSRPRWRSRFHRGVASTGVLPSRCRS